jgi:hypothetical protein
MEVPHSVFATLSAVIRGRKDCAAWYLLNQDHADDTMKTNNDRHQHFIKILEDTLQILKKKQPQTKQSSISTEDTYVKKVANMFECLELSETDESEEIPESIPTVPKVEKNVKYKLEASDADVSFAVYCFLKDLTNIRLFVRRTWREFKHGKIGLSAAAVTMNAAIGMIEKLSDEFQEAFLHFKKRLPSTCIRRLSVISIRDTAMIRKDPISSTSRTRSAILSPTRKAVRHCIQPR